MDAENNGENIFVRLALFVLALILYASYGDQVA